MKSLHSLLVLGLITAANSFSGIGESLSLGKSSYAPKLSYKQRHDDRAPFIYITVNDSITYEKNGIKQDGLTLLGSSGFGTDLIVYPTGFKSWDWTAHTPHTHHRPGILPADVKELVEEHKVDIVILSKGVEEVLQVDPSTIEYLKKHKKEYYIIETRKAIDKYNELIAKGKKVGGLFHTTC